MAIKEIWCPIPGYEDYEASNLGRIRSVDRWNYFGKHRRWLFGRVLKSRVSGRSRYAEVNLLGHSFAVHQLVMLAWMGPPPEGMQVCHNERGHLDNRLDNLRYDTRPANEADKEKHGTLIWGERHHHAKLTEADVRAIRASSEASATLAARYGVTQRHIRGVRQGKYWRRVLA